MRVARIRATGSICLADASDLVPTDPVVAHHDLDAQVTLDLVDSVQRALGSDPLDIRRQAGIHERPVTGLRRVFESGAEPRRYIEVAGVFAQSRLSSSPVRRAPRSPIATSSSSLSQSLSTSTPPARTIAALRGFAPTCSTRAMADVLFGGITSISSFRVLSLKR